MKNKQQNVLTTYPWSTVCVCGTVQTEQVNQVSDLKLQLKSHILFI